MEGLVKATQAKRIKKTPMRTCVGCGTARAKRELVRVVRTPEGEVVADATGRRSGRGAYVDPSGDCLTKAFAAGALDRALALSIGQEQRARLLEEVRRLAAERSTVVEVKR